MENIMDSIYEMKENVAHEIGDANDRIREAGGKINLQDLDAIYKLSKSAMALVTTCAMLKEEEEDEDGGYSGRWMPPGPVYNPGITYGYSRRGERRDDYSRNGTGNGYSGNHGGYSRNDGRYSRNGYSRNGDMGEQLRQMMEDAPDDLTRMEIKKLMDRMENQR